VQEGDLVAPGPDPGLWIDKLDAGILEAMERLRQVRNPIGDVMEARATAFEEPAHGSIGSEWLDEFDGPGKGSTYTLSFQGFGRGTALPGQEFKEATGLFQRGNGHGDVVQRVRKHFRVVAWMKTRDDPGGA
jgi:hypothetical protein